jgi:glycosyltransferase involved in cell wall biosynthesis
VGQETGPGGVSVLITLLNDPRVARSLESLSKQELPPSEILVADGGSTDGSTETARRFIDGRVRVEVIPGSVAVTRNRALRLLEGSIVAFLDADEVAPSQWLRALTEPIRRGEADFTGGPTLPIGQAGNPMEAYLNAFDGWLYGDLVPRDITMLPMGNSAWRVDLLRSIGGFDERLAWGGEDYDVNLRAVARGYRGLFVPGAWVYHDQSRLNTRRKILRRRYRYSVGATMAYLKNGVLSRKAFPALSSVRTFRHPMERLNLLIMPVALVHGVMAWGFRRR